MGAAAITPRLWGWGLGSALVALVVAGVVAEVPTAARAQTGGGTDLVDVTFAGPAVLDPNFSVQGATCLTGRPVGSPLEPGAANIPDCSAHQGGPVPMLGELPGYLQITDAVDLLTGSILYNRPVPSSAGVIATFDQWQYGGDAADGIAFFLVDGATNLTTPGGFGGSLGYAQRTGQAGILGGYIGVGFDVFGNFYNDREGRGNNCPPNQKPPVANPPLVKNAIVVRGPGNGNNGYCYQGSTTVGPIPVSSLPGSLQGADLATGQRRVTITVSPAPAPRVTVTVDFGSGPKQVLDIPAPPDPPATYKFGWTASTGAQNDVHLIRNVVVKTVNPLADLDLVKQINLATPLPNPLRVGDTVPYQFVVTNSGLETLDDLRISDPLVVNAMCPKTTIDPAPLPTSTVICTGSHIVTQADVNAGRITNTAVATAVDAGDQLVTSNESSVTVSVGSTPRITLEKLILTPPPYTFGSTITYRYDVTNTGTVTVQNPAVTDDKVSGIVCPLPTTLLPRPQFPNSVSCLATYTIVESDVDANGFLTNTATATATPATGGTVTSNPSSQSLAVGTDIEVTKDVDDPTPFFGDIVTFTVTATNNGPANATGLEITDPIGPGVVFIDAETTTGTTYDPATGLWNIGNLTVGDTATLQLFLQVATIDPYTNTATVSDLVEPDIDPDNDTDEATITPVQEADVAMVKEVDDDTPAVGETITFTITATNNGPSPATGVVVEDLLPTGLTLTSATPSQGDYDVPPTWNVGSIAVDQSATLVLTALVEQAGAFTNTARYTGGDQLDPDPSNDTASVDLTATRVANLSITKTDGRLIVLAGNPLTYTITVANAGPSDVVGATVTDVFPPELTGVTWTCVNDLQSTCGDASGSGNINTTVDLPRDRSVTFTVSATVAPGASGTLSNTATVMPPAGTTDPNPGNDTDTDTTMILASADLVASKSALAPVVPGTNLVFTVGVTNLGPSSATSVVLTDPTPPGLIFVSNAGDCITAYPCALGTLAPIASRTITTTYLVPPGYTTPDPIVNTVTAASPTPDPTPENNTATASVSVLAPSADLAVTKSNGVDTVTAGTPTTYTITVLNRGPSNVAGVTVTDMVPAELTDVSWTCTSSGGSCAVAGGTGSIMTTVDLPLNATATFLLTGTVRPGAQGRLENTVRATPPMGTGDPSGATATDVDDIVSQVDVSIAKTGPATIVPGNDLAYTIVVRNNGPSTARDVTVSDPPPSGLTFVSNAGACTTAFPCDLGAIEPTGSRTITATFSVPEGYTAPNPIVNVARVSAAGTADKLAMAETLVDTRADVAVTKSVAPATALVGDTVVFTIGVANNGPNAATGVIVTDLLPAGLALTDVAASLGVYLASPRGEWSIGRLANGAGAQLTLTALVTQPGAITNIATKTAANEPDPDTSNDSAAATVNGGAYADVGLRKTVDVATPAVDDTVTFTVTATNNGPSGATAIVVRDLLPAGLVLVPPAVPSQGGYDETSGDWTLGDLGVGGSATLTLRAQVGQAGPLVNNARKTAQGEPDPNPANDQASVTVNGAGTADIAVAKGVSNPSPAVGEQVTFTVVVTNLGPEPATGVVVSDPVPAGAAFVDSVPSQGTYDPATGLWAIGALAPSQSAVLVLTLTPTQAGAVTNTATRTESGPLDPNPANDSASATDEAGLVADLSITKTDGLDTVFAGEAVTYTITVENLGPSPVSNVPVEDRFPAILRAVTWTCVPDPGSRCSPITVDNPDGTASGAGDIVVLVDFLPAGGRVVFTASGTLVPDATGSLVNTTRVTPPEGVDDPDLANNVATDTTAITLAANLEIMKTGPATAVSGTAVVYTLVVTNAGPSTASPVTVNDPTPPGLAFVSNAGDCVTAFPCDLGLLNPGDQRTIAATYTVLPGAGVPTAVVNTATVSSPIPDPNPENNTSSKTTEITPSADVAVTKSSPASVGVGADLVYTIRVTNAGPDSAVGVTLTDPVPAGTDLVSVTASQGSCAGAATVTCALGTVPVGTVVTVTITVTPRAAAAGTVTNTVTVASVTPDPDPADNTASAQTTVSPDANLVLVKSVTPQQVLVGDALTYSLVVTNRGPAPATGVTLTDSLPTGVTSPTVTSTQGTCTLAGNAVSCVLGDLAVNATATVTIMAFREAPEAFSNTATTTGNELDPDPGDNTSTATTPAATGEDCGNCVDDDADGLVDYADPDCCTQFGTLAVTRVRIAPRKGNARNAKLRLTGTLGGAGFSAANPRQEEMSLYLSDGTTVAACCTITQERWMRLFKQKYGFWDQRARICPPIADVSLRQKRDGAGIVILSPHFDLTDLTGPDLQLTVRVGGSCAATTVPLRRTKSGAVVFP